MRRLLAWGPPLGLMALLFVASASPFPARVPAVISDKVLHLGAYAALGLLFLRALVDTRLDRITAGYALAAFVLTVIYGISDELHQAFVPGRTPDAMDVVADALGAATGVGVLWLIGRRFRRAQVDHAHVNRRPE